MTCGHLNTSHDLNDNKEPQNYKVNQNTHALTDQRRPTFSTSAPAPPFATASTAAAPVHPAPPVRATRSSKGFTFRATVKPAAAPPMLRQLLAST